MDALSLRLGLAGVGTYAASGDSGSTCDGLPYAGVAWPAPSPYVTAVGGTRVTLNRANQRTNEVVWNDTLWTPASMGGGASGGRFSIASPRPPYQDGLGLPGQRATPDVSPSASNFPGWPVELGSTWTIDGGTSGSAPLVTAAMAVPSADQQTPPPPADRTGQRTLHLPRHTRAEHDLRRRQRHQQLHAKGAGLPGTARLRPARASACPSSRRWRRRSWSRLLPVSDGARDHQALGASLGTALMISRVG